MDEALAESLGLDGTEGARVAEVRDGPAQRGGIQAGAVITRLDGQANDSARAL
jgi:S1-C subfamily serine protease